VGIAKRLTVFALLLLTTYPAVIRQNDVPFTERPPENVQLKPPIAIVFPESEISSHGSM
jgi:hypothetical protein